MTQLALILSVILPSQPPAVTNPHWSTDGCKTCHVTGDYNDINRAELRRSELCLACHDGKSAMMERHPVGRTFSNPQINKPDDWPAPEGRLACVTCHDVAIACRQPTPRSTVNPKFLRPAQLNTTNPQSMSPETAFCASCHIPAPQAEMNPHRMLTSDGQSIDTACSYCHAPNMDRSRHARSGDAQLLTSEPLLCFGCHRSHNDYFEPGHIGAKIPETMQAYLQSQSAGLAGEASTPLADVLPAGKGGVVVCSTCHNPHQAGLFPSHSSLGQGGVVFAGDDVDRNGSGMREYGPSLRLPVNQFCAGCHGD